MKLGWSRGFEPSVHKAKGKEAGILHLTFFITLQDGICE